MTSSYLPCDVIKVFSPLMLQEWFWRVLCDWRKGHKVPSKIFHLDQADTGPVMIGWDCVREMGVGGLVVTTLQGDLNVVTLQKEVPHACILCWKEIMHFTRITVFQLLFTVGLSQVVRHEITRLPTHTQVISILEPMISMGLKLKWGTCTFFSDTQCGASLALIVFSRGSHDNRPMPPSAIWGAINNEWHIKSNTFILVRSMITSKSVHITSLNKGSKCPCYFSFPARLAILID